MKNGFRLGSTERKLLAFTRKLAKETHNAPFSPDGLMKAGWTGDKKTLSNTLRRLVKKGFLTRLLKGLYKNARPGQRVPVKKAERVVVHAQPLKRLSAEEWRMRIDATMNGRAEELVTIDRKIEENHERIKELQEEIKELQAQKAKVQRDQDEQKKVFDLVLKNPEAINALIGSGILEFPAARK